MWFRWGVPLIVFGLLACGYLGWAISTWWDRRRREEEGDDE